MSKEKSKEKNLDKVSKEKGLAEIPKEKALTTMNFEQDAGDGFGNADKDSFAIPFLSILQSNSPQLDDGKPEYLPAARPGMFFNSATKELFDGKDAGILLVPAHFQRKFVEWRSRDEGGGYVREYDPSQIDLDQLERDDSGRYLIGSDGHYLSDTRYHFCVLLTPDGASLVVLSLSSTQIKKSRAWLTTMNALKLTGKDGKKFTPPTYSHVYRATTVSEQNEKGSWKGAKFELVRPLSADEIGVYQMAKEFKRQVTAGVARVEEPSDTAQHEEAF